MVTIREVALRAGVSKGTVSNVLNRPSYVSTNTREAVERAIAELGFEPRSSSRQFRPGRERTLGLVVVDMGNPFFVDVALGAQEMARSQGSAIVFCDSSEDTQREVYNLDLLVQLRVQGVLITPVQKQNPRLDALLERGVPVVFIDRVSSSHNCCSVSSNDVRGGALAGQHLADRGHEHIAFVGDPSISPQMADRYQGMVEVVGESRVELITVSDWTMPQGSVAGESIAKRPAARRPTAVFCANDLLAIGLYRALARGGIRVPHDIAVVGYDDLIWAEAGAVPLTSVKQSRQQMGRTAVRLVLSEIEEGPRHQHEHVIFQPELVIRASSDIQAGRRRGKVVGSSPRETSPENGPGDRPFATVPLAAGESTPRVLRRRKESS